VPAHPLAPAPIQFVNPTRVKASGLLPPPRLLSVAQIAKLRDTSDHGIALFPVEGGNVAIRVGAELDGLVGYASAEHGIAFVSAVVTIITDERRAQAVADREAARIAQERAPSGSFTAGRAADGSFVRLGEVKGGGADADGDNW